MYKPINLFETGPLFRQKNFISNFSESLGQIERPKAYKIQIPEILEAFQAEFSRIVFPIVSNK